MCEKNFGMSPKCPKRPINWSKSIRSNCAHSYKFRLHPIFHHSNVNLVANEYLFFSFFLSFFFTKKNFFTLFRVTKLNCRLIKNILLDYLSHQLDLQLCDAFSFISVQSKIKKTQNIMLYIYSELSQKIKKNEKRKTKFNNFCETNLNYDGWIRK